MPISNELKQAAITAVRRAATVCRSVQRDLITEDTLAKKDKSPVTVADFASQAIVCHTLREADASIPVLAEEAAYALRGDDAATLRNNVTQHVGSAVGSDVSEDDALAWIDLGGHDGSADRYWTLDPIDGTKGFLRGQQYAVALGLIEDGQVTFGVLGCPNLPPHGVEWTGDGENPGTLLIAETGGGTHALPLWSDSMQLQPIDAAADVPYCFCESVESGHSDQDASVQIAEKLGITAAPVRLDSQAKYAIVARGEAAVYLRLPTRKDYREKVWDHAAGLICVTEAGGAVTDVTGQPLDFSLGRALENNQGVIATRGADHAKVVDAVQSVLSEPG